MILIKNRTINRFIFYLAGNLPRHKLEDQGEMRTEGGEERGPHGRLLIGRKLVNTQYFLVKFKIR